MYTIEKQYRGFCCNWFKRNLRLIVLVIFTLARPGAAFADEVTDWNRIALYVAAHRSDSLSVNAWLFALLNLAASDATIIAWDAKYHYNSWRPITAIREAGADGNDETVPNAMWSPFQMTPNHQEYVSGHSAISGAAARTLAALFGDNVAFTHESDALAGVTRAHASFSAAAEEASESRIFTGAHFRSSANDRQAAGEALGNFVAAKIARPNSGNNPDLPNPDSSAKPNISAFSCLPAINIYPETLPSGTLGEPYSQTFTHQGGGYSEVSWYIPYGGVLPSGLTLNAASGALSGIPTATGAYHFFVRATSTFNGWCYGERHYEIAVKAATATSLTASANPATTGQTVTLTAQVRASSVGALTGAIQFTVNGSPVGIAVPVVSGAASLNITASAASSFTASASYSGDADFLPSSNGFTISVFNYSVKDAATGDQLFFNTDGTYLFKHGAGESSLILKGRGTVVPSATGCNITLEHSAADREVIAEVNPCQHTGAATVVYQGVTYTLSEGVTAM
jgi:Big-like domain-containing protein/putative Ig domain-containing protein/PAP2 superfamily protein